MFPRPLRHVVVDTIRRLLVNVSGYVIDKAPLLQYFNGGRLEDGNTQFLLYVIRQENGMKGSPIFALFGNTHVVVGIRTYGSDRGNRARRIDDSVFDVLARLA